MASVTAPYKVLFLGIEFDDAYHLTAKALAADPRFTVARCAREEAAVHIRDAQLAVPFMARVDASLLAAAPALRYVLQFGVGLEGVDMAAAAAAGVRVANIPSGGTGNAAATAEMALYLTLALFRDAHGMAAAFAARRLGSPTGKLLRGSSALLVGYGAIGREVAQRLTALGVRVSAVRRGLWQADEPGAEQLIERGCGRADTLRMLGAADVVILALTQNALTRGLVDAEFLAAMRPRARLVNVSRGGLLDYDAVLAALTSGHLGGLGSDVAWAEPWDPADAVACHPHVIFTPHVGGVTDVSYGAMADVVAEEARRDLAGLAAGADVCVHLERQAA